ncbi:MAG TPA: mechanosensitive ion channel family protein [Bacteroidales bacterium]|nr:mechanosensitive ion channel family protein [Bacteroidales bacterium]HSA44348.1 mechanosensitive ion channel family protein [Bacteroidales bacterium]
MNARYPLIALLVLLRIHISVGSADTISDYDSANIRIIKQFNLKLAELEKLRQDDSVRKAMLEAQLRNLKTSDLQLKNDIIKQLQEINESENRRLSMKKAKIDSLRHTAKGYPVIGVLNDTLFLIYSKIGASTAKDRADNITRKIKHLYNDDFLFVDSISIQQSENTFDIAYKDMIIMSISETDAMWFNKSIKALAEDNKALITKALVDAKKANSLGKQLMRIGLVVFVVLIAWLFLWLIGKAYRFAQSFIDARKDRWLQDLQYRDYTFLTAEQELKGILFIIKILRWLTYALLFYLTLPVIFSIFPFSRTWADALFSLIWSPFRSALTAMWEYLPNLIRILVIIFIMKYLIRFVKYIFREMETERLKIKGFHPDWAKPTFNITKFLFYAFTFVLIFPYLPGSDSAVFRGVSVFIGILFSLGSSSVITNMIAGLVITYMRPFKINDRIKIGEITGDVVEKTLLVTRVRTIKQEIITIPNSSVLTGNTTNYSIEAARGGLIIHTTVTISYDVPWKQMHQALIGAALRTADLMKTPAPFVLQTSLDDFYVSYQINAYTREAAKQATIYSELHQNIQDVCAENGIEIMSPHYRAARDGNQTTIPSSYLPPDYKSPGFNISCDIHKEKND